MPLSCYTDRCCQCLVVFVGHPHLVLRMNAYALLCNQLLYFVVPGVADARSFEGHESLICRISKVV